MRPKAGLPEAATNAPPSPRAADSLLSRGAAVALDDAEPYVMRLAAAGHEGGGLERIIGVSAAFWFLVN
jgi:hypothetical protein